MSYDAVVIDLDGTLLDSTGKVSEQTQEVLSRLYERGIPVHIATGRPMAGARSVTDHLKLAPEMAVFNGTHLVNRETLESIQALYLPDEVVEGLCDRYEDEGHDHIVYHGETKFMRSLRHHDFNRQLSEIFINTVMTNERGDVPIGLHPRVSTYGYPDDLKGIPEFLNDFEHVYAEVFPCSAIAAFPDSRMLYMEAQAVCSGKKELLDWLVKERGMKYENIAVFGDQTNDLSMMSCAGRSFAMSNAFPSVKEAADEVIGSNDEDAVAKKLTEMFLT